jgi:hypothetical protein
MAAVYVVAFFELDDAVDEDFPKRRFFNLPFDNIYRACDYCGEYKKIAVLNQLVYYDEGRKRKLVFYCDDCDRIPLIKRELIDGGHNSKTYRWNVFEACSECDCKHKREFQSIQHSLIQSNINETSVSKNS